MLTSFGDVAEVFGPTLAPESILPGAQQKMNGSMLVVEAPSIEEVKSIVESDIYYKTNVVSPHAPRSGPRIPLIWRDSGIRRRSSSRR
jgi:hypothetical protein